MLTSPSRSPRRSTPSSRTCPSVGSTSRTSSPASVDLPEPVGPTTATVVPAGTSNVTPSRVGRATPSKVKPTSGDAEVRAAGARGRGVRPVRRLAGGLQHRRDPVHPGQRAGQVGEHPADGADRQRQEGEQVGDGDQLAGVGAAVGHPAGPDEQDGEGAQARQRLHHRVEQPADPADGDEAVAQLLRPGAEPLGLLRLAAQGLDDERGVEALVGDLADLGAELLRPLRPRAHHLRVDDVDDEDRGEDDQADERDQRIGEEQRHHRDRDHHQRTAGEGQGRDEEPGRLDVGVRVGEQLARGVALVPGQRQAQVLAGDAAAVVGLQPVAHDPGEQPPAEDADDLQDGDADDRQRREGQRRRGGGALGERGQQHAVGDLADDVGARDRHRAVEAAGGEGEGEHARLLDDRAPDVTEPAPHDGVSAAGHGSPLGRSDGGVPMLRVR